MTLEVNCVQPDERRLPEGAMFTWSLDTCATAKFVPDVRADDSNDPELNGNNYEPGFFQMRTSFPAPFFDPVGSAAPGTGIPVVPAERCAYHWGSMYVDDQGFAAPVFCSVPSATAGQLQFERRQSRCIVEMQQSNDPTSGIESGFYFFAGACESVPWTEAHYHSKPVICGEGEI